MDNLKTLDKWVFHITDNGKYRQLDIIDISNIHCSVKS